MTMAKGHPSKKRVAATSNTKRGYKYLKELKKSGSLKKEVKVKYRRHSNALSKRKNKHR